MANALKTSWAVIHTDITPYAQGAEIVTKVFYKPCKQNVRGGPLWKGRSTRKQTLVLSNRDRIGDVWEMLFDHIVKVRQNQPIGITWNVNIDYLLNGYWAGVADGVVRAIAHELGCVIEWGDGQLANTTEQRVTQGAMRVSAAPQ